MVLGLVLLDLVVIYCMYKLNQIYSWAQNLSLRLNLRTSAGFFIRNSKTYRSWRTYSMHSWRYCKLQFCKNAILRPNFLTSVSSEYPARNLAIPVNQTSSWGIDWRPNWPKCSNSWTAFFVKILPPPHHLGNRHPIGHWLGVSWFLPQRVGSRLDQGNEKQTIPNPFSEKKVWSKGMKVNSSWAGLIWHLYQSGWTSL